MGDPLHTRSFLANGKRKTSSRKILIWKNLYGMDEDSSLYMPNYVKVFVIRGRHAEVISRTS